MQIIVSRAPNGRRIVDTLVTDEGGLGAVAEANRLRAQAHKRVWRLIRDIGAMRTRLHRLGALVDRDLRDDDASEQLAMAQGDLLVLDQSIKRIEESVAPMHKRFPRRRR